MKISKLFVLCMTTLMVVGSAPVFAQGVFEGTADWDPFDDTHVEGSVNVSGSGADAVYELEGNGNDIWENEDEGFFVYAEKSGSWSLTSRVEWIEPGANDWSKAGIMVRTDPEAADAANYAVVLRGAMDTISAQWRPEAGAASLSARHRDDEGNEISAGDDNAVWIRVQRVANDFWLSEYSQDGETWNYGHSFTMELPESLAWGLAITNHEDNEVLAAANASNVLFEETPAFHPVARRMVDGDLNIFGGSIFYSDGQEANVTLEIFSPSEQDVTVTETLPEGWTASDISDGGTESGGVITWDLTAAEGSTTVSYTVTMTGFGNFDGDVDGYGTSQELSLSYIKPGMGIFDGGSVDVGDVGMEGSAEFADGTYTVTGSGADIWGTADEFHFLYTEMTGSFEIEVGEIFPVDSPHEWSKAGIMVRESLAPGSKNIFPMSRGYNFEFRTQYRPENGAETGNSGTVSPDNQLGQMRLVRFGDHFTVEYFDLIENDWVINYETTLKMEDPVLLGLAVTSHDDASTLSTEFIDVSITEYPFSVERVMDSFGLIPGESTTITLSVDVREGETTDFTIVENYPADKVVVSDVSASSGEVEDDGNGTITWTASGIDADTTLTYTITANADATGTGLISGTYDDGSGYSGDLGDSALAFYDFDADISPFVESVDVGDVATPGMSGKFGDTYAVVGSGADIWGTADEFHFAYFQAEGDFTFTVDNITMGGVGFNVSTNEWQKAGLMVRDTLDAGSVMVDAILGIDDAFMLQWRDTVDAEAASTGDTTYTYPDTYAGSFRLTREGDTFTALYEDANGDFIVNEAHDVVMTDPVYVGLAVTSHSDGATTLGTFENPVFEGNTVSVNGWMLY